MTDYLICGAGISGLLLARELLLAGASVRVVERGSTGQEASWAGGGIVSPLYPWRYHPAVTALAARAQQAYPQLSAELAAQTGIDPEYFECGLLMLDAADAADALDWASHLKMPMSAWDARQIYAAQAGLADGFTSGLWMPTVANVRNPRLLQALVQWIRQHPLGAIQENTEVLGFDCHDQQVRRVTVRQQGVAATLPAGHVVVTAGAWTANLLGQLNLRLPVAPVKGQMLLYKPEQRLLDSIILTQGRYLIPRRDGHIVVGSTLELSGFDKTPDGQALHSLRSSACQMLPALAKETVVRQWAGLRPGSPLGIPFIGRLPEFKNLSINAGHYRNGLVLAPASARLLADLLLDRRPAVDPSPYDPGLRLAQLTQADFTAAALIADNTSQAAIKP